MFLGKKKNHNINNQYEIQNKNNLVYLNDINIKLFEKIIKYEKNNILELNN